MESNESLPQSELDKNLRVLGREVEESLGKKLKILEQIYGVLINAQVTFEIQKED